MFDIGFFELLIVGIVGLLVIGPEQLPGTIRSLALWWGRFKRGLQSTKKEFEQQIGADDIRRQLHNEAVNENIESINESLAQGTDKVDSDVKKSDPKR